MTNDPTEMRNDVDSPLLDLFAFALALTLSTQQRGACCCGYRMTSSGVPLDDDDNTGGECGDLFFFLERLLGSLTRVEECHHRVGYT